MNLRIHPEVKTDLREAVHFYEDAQPGLGELFMDAFDSALDRIVANPLRWRRIKDENRRTDLKRFPYFLVFTFDGDSELELYALMHQRRHPEFWYERLETMPEKKK